MDARLKAEIDFWENGRALWKAELEAHAAAGERPTARYAAYVWWVWYGQDEALDRVGRTLSQHAPADRDYWNNVGYYLLYPDSFEGDWEQWEIRPGARSLSRETPEPSALCLHPASPTPSR